MKETIPVNLRYFNVTITVRDIRNLRMDSYSAAAKSQNGFNTKSGDGFNNIGKRGITPEELGIPVERINGMLEDGGNTAPAIVTFKFYDCLFDVDLAEQFSTVDNGVDANEATGAFGFSYGDVDIISVPLTSELLKYNIHADDE